MYNMALKIDFIKKIKNNKVIRFLYGKGVYFFYKWILTDKKAINRQFKKRLNRSPNLENPVLFTDKLQWLKLNWYDERATTRADKYKVREVVSNIIGNE